VPLRLLLAVLLVSTPIAAVDDKPAPLRVLFVGNSLTYTNDLPRMVARLAELDGRSCETTMIAVANHSLADHLDSPRFQREIRAKWDFVVLQQGPSSLDASRQQLVRDTKAIAGLLKGTAARVALVTVWPASSRVQTWERVAESYRVAAEAVDGLWIPAGVNLRLAMQQDRTLKVLGADGFHPAMAGTYLAALTTYHSLTGSLPAASNEPKTARRIAGGELNLTDEQLRLLVRIATAR
jgi:hypothetical protein